MRTCGTLCGDTVDCRVWLYNGTEVQRRPRSHCNAILREVYSTKQGNLESEAYHSLNLETYFSAKASKDEAELQLKSR